MTVALPGMHLHTRPICRHVHSAPMPAATHSGAPLPCGPCMRDMGSHVAIVAVALLACFPLGTRGRDHQSPSPAEAATEVRKP